MATSTAHNRSSRLRADFEPPDSPREKGQNIVITIKT
jgi:hypothetical protein